MNNSPRFLKDRQSSDPVGMRKAFNLTADEFDESAWLYRETAARLMEHLELNTLTPQGVLDLGSATGDLSLALAARFKPSQIYTLDFAKKMLFHARRKASRWFRHQDFICTDARKIGLKDSCVQLICSNLLLPWVADLNQTLAESYRVLDNGGLIMLSNFGPQTLKELRQAAEQVGQALPEHHFVDMLDLGNTLSGAGFADVVVDVERLRVSYRSLGDLLREVDAVGFGAIDSDYSSALLDPQMKEKLEQACEGFREENLYYITIELSFAQGWKAPHASTSREVEVAWQDL